MLTAHNVLGLVFSNMHDSSIADLTKERAMGSVLFGGRYRLIDFPLSNLVNSGVPEVGVVTKSNYQSLLDHLGSGREWDLSRKSGGLHLLPPFANVGSGMYRGRLEALAGIKSFVDNSFADYVIMTDCNVVTTIDYSKALNKHIESEADITCIYAKSPYDSDVNATGTVFGIDATGRINDVLVTPTFKGECNLSLDMFILSKAFLKKIVNESISRNLYSFIKDIIQSYKGNYKILAYEHKGYFLRIDSMLSYYRANMALLNLDNRNALYKQNTPIYTKSSDYGPVKYGLSTEISNCLIADGSIIDGTVENSVIFRGVKVAKGAKVSGCILMQGSTVDKGANISNVITDKIVEIGEEKVLTGSETYPLYINKGAKII